MANNLYFDAELLEDDLRAIIKNCNKNENSINLFGELHLIPKDSDLNSDIITPAISIEVYKNGPVENKQEDIEVEPYSRFSVNIETYVGGENKRSLNMKLAQFMIFTLQKNQQLNNYYNRGLKLDRERELSSFIDGVNRRQIRFSGIVDNASKLIYNKEI